MRSWLIAVSILALAAPIGAQDTTSFPAPWRPLRIAKWTTAAGAAGAALYGFYHNQQADDAYERLEQDCQASPIVCDARHPDGAYADAGLEAQYRQVQHHDRHARAGLIAGQIGVATSVVLFILDLRNDRPPPNIPYEPRSFQVGPTRDGGLGISYRLRTR